MEALLLVSLIGWSIVSFFVASYAKNKGRSYGGFLALALVFSPVIALIIAAIVKDESENVALSAGELRKCPYCGESIKATATVCRFCGREVEPFVLHNPKTSNTRMATAPFNGELDISNPKYQLFLTKRFDIQRNNTLSKFVIDDEVFGTLEDSLQAAHTRYAQEQAWQDVERASEQHSKAEKETLETRLAERQATIQEALSDKTGKLINKFDKHGMTPIMNAIQLRDQKLIRDLLNAGAKQNQMWFCSSRACYMSVKDIAREAGPEILALFERA